MKALLHLLTVLAGTYFLLLVYLYLRQEAFIFFPSKIPVQHHHVLNQYRHAAISFPAPKSTLNGWFIDRGTPLIIYYGGNGEEVSGNLFDVNKFSCGSLLFVNYRGYGANDGKPTEKNLYTDALSIYDTMVGQYGFNPEQIILMGRSLGSAVAVHVAANRRVKAVILITPFNSMVKVGKTHYPLFPLGLLLKHRFDSIKIVSDLTVPMLTIIAEKDEIIPKACSLNLLQGWGGSSEMITIKSAGHNDISGYPEYWRGVNGFLDRQY
ncbi:MAG: alpha/beta hydrolase [Candidatus Marinimicrobia bacterium]|nr:alpha/beta hydrolase [Candidatus Neomarinimicrobiota bacterium]